MLSKSTLGRHSLASSCFWHFFLLAIQVHKSHLTKHAVVHDAVVDFHGRNDRQGHCV